MFNHLKVALVIQKLKELLCATGSKCTSQPSCNSLIIASDRMQLSVCL